MNSKNIKTALIIFISISLIGFSFFATAEETTNKNIFLDTDQDGLSNDEEVMYGTDPENADSDSDGYSDGVEIEGGYDPLVPAPGDRLESINDEPPISQDSLASNSETIDNEDESTDSNVTDDASNKIAELITASSAENEAITITEIQDVVDDLMESTSDFEDLPEISDEDIKVKVQNYSKYSDDEREELLKKDAVDYLVAVSYIAASNSPRKISNVEDIADFGEELFEEIEVFALSFANITYFENLILKGEVALEQMKEVAVPEELVDFHKRGLQLANYAIDVDATTDINMEDPIAGLQDLSKVQGLINLSIQFAEDINLKMEELGIGSIPIDI